MTRIDNYDDLLRERKVLETSLSITGAKIKTELVEIKDRMKPIGTILGKVGKLANNDTTNPIAGVGISMVITFLLKHLVLRKAGWIWKLVTPFIVKNFVSSQVCHSENIFQKAFSFFKKKMSDVV